MQRLEGIRPYSDDRVVAELARVAEAGTCLWSPWTSQTNESTSITSRPDPGPAPAAQARRSDSASTRSSWRTCPNVKPRKNVPSVEGASTRWPTTRLVSPTRSTSQSSIESAPSSIACTSDSTFAPAPDPAERSASETDSSTRRSTPSRSQSVAASTTPALATIRSSSKTASNRSNPRPPRPAESVTIKVTS